MMSIITKLSPWTPKKLSGCALFLDASMGVTTVDNKCSQWSDQSGNVRHASQSTAGYRPEFVANPQTNQWSGALSPSGTPPTARYAPTSVIYGDYMYVFGGSDGSGKNDLHRLDLTTLTWSGALSPSGTPPTARAHHTSVIYGDYMYVFGGSDGSCKNDLHRLDLTTLTWSGALSPSGTPPTVRYCHTSVIYGNYMYVFGGIDNSSNKNDLHRLDLTTLTWSGALSPSGTPPTDRRNHTSVIYGNCMYVFDGYGNSNKNDLHRLDLTTLTWSGALSPSGTPPTARNVHTSVIYGDYMYVFGGHDGSHKNDLHRLDLTTLTWSGALSPSGTPPTARYHHTSVIYGNYMYVFCGLLQFGRTNDVHRTDLSAVTSALNGRPVLRFDNTDDSLVYNTDALGITSTSGCTLFYVCKGVGFAFYLSPGIANTARGIWYSGTKLAIGNWGTDLYSDIDAVSSSRFDVFTASYGPVANSPVQGYVSGTKVIDSFLNISDPTNTYCIGYPPNYKANNDIAAIIVFNRTLSDAERQRVERWLATRYGITLA